LALVREGNEASEVSIRFRRCEHVAYHPGGMHEFMVESREPGTQHKLPRNMFDKWLGRPGGLPADAQTPAVNSSMRQSLPNSGPAGPSADPPTPSGAASITSAFQKQLGLKLEATKEPADTVVVDKFDKTPVAN